MSLTAERLREVLLYNSDTGLLVWAKTLSNSAVAGSSAGWPQGKGYLGVSIDGKSYVAHRLAWLYRYGEWPRGLIDHVDRDRSNNRIANLRLADKSLNGANRGAQVNNSTGVKGVYFDKRIRSMKFSSRICCRGVDYSLGTFDTIDEAQAAYAAASQKLFGDYARTI